MDDEHAQWVEVGNWHGDGAGIRALASLRTEDPAAWELKGQVVDIPSLTGIEGAKVEARRLDSGETSMGETDAAGLYDLKMAAPRPETVRVTFSAKEYKGDEVDIRTGAAFKEQMFREK